MPPGSSLDVFQS